MTRRDWGNSKRDVLLMSNAFTFLTFFEESENRWHQNLRQIKTSVTWHQDTLLKTAYKAANVNNSTRHNIICNMNRFLIKNKALIGTMPASVRSNARRAGALLSRPMLTSALPECYDQDPKSNQMTSWQAQHNAEIQSVTRQAMVSGISKLQY